MSIFNIKYRVKPVVGVNEEQTGLDQFYVLQLKKWYHLNWHNIFERPIIGRNEAWIALKELVNKEQPFGL